MTTVQGAHWATLKPPRTRQHSSVRLLSNTQHNNMQQHSSTRLLSPSSSRPPASKHNRTSSPWVSRLNYDSGGRVALKQEITALRQQLASALQGSTRPQSPNAQLPSTSNSANCTIPGQVGRQASELVSTHTPLLASYDSRFEAIDRKPPRKLPITAPDEADDVLLCLNHEGFVDTGTSMLDEHGSNDAVQKTVAFEADDNVEDGQESRASTANGRQPNGASDHGLQLRRTQTGRRRVPDLRRTQHELSAPDTSTIDAWEIRTPHLTATMPVHQVVPDSNAYPNKDLLEGGSELSERFDLATLERPLPVTLARSFDDEPPYKKRLVNRNILGGQPRTYRDKLQQRQLANTPFSRSKTIRNLQSAASMNDMQQRESTVLGGSTLRPKPTLLGTDSGYPSNPFGSTWDFPGGRDSRIDTGHGLSLRRRTGGEASRDALTINKRSREEPKKHREVPRPVSRYRAQLPQRNSPIEYGNFTSNHDLTFDGEEDHYETFEVGFHDEDTAGPDSGDEAGAGSELDRTYENFMQELHMAQGTSKGSRPDRRKQASPDDFETLSASAFNTTAHRSRKSATTPTARGTTSSGTKKRMGKQKQVKSLTPLQMFIYVPETAQDGTLKPLSALPPALGNHLSTWLDSLFNDEKYFAKACKMTEPQHQAEYIASGLCVAFHTIWKSKKGVRITANLKHACNTCCDAASPRYCVRLEENPTDPNANAILVFYPRPADRRPAAATWTSPQFWLGIHARTSDV